MELAEKFPLHLYNSYTRKKELFKPLNPPFVGMYACGPTVYSAPHLGHARQAVVFDVVFRYLRHLGYRVRYVRNITDVGHLEDEVAGQGEDRIAKKARLEKIEPMEVVQTYTLAYHKAMARLNTLPPSIEPQASGHIPEQIEAIQKMFNSGFAYEVDGSVYFDLNKYAAEQPYGTLSGKVLEDLQVGSRDTEGLDQKRGPHDFALWKKAEPHHIMQWNSPWGAGFPGWHLECSVMSTKYLGEEFDIHGGGMDLQFPHHEAELAQNYGCCGKHAVRYWMHNNMLTIEGQKMARSKGNFITTEEMFSGDHDLLEQPYSPMTVRFFTLQAHYRSPVDFSNSALQAAEKGYRRLMNAVAALAELKWMDGEIDTKLDADVNNWLDQLYTEMGDDFNTAKVLAVLFELTTKVNEMKAGNLNTCVLSESTFIRLQKTVADFVSDVLGLEEEAASNDAALDGVIGILIRMRADARANKDFATSDRIRDELIAAGITLEDGKGGTNWIAAQ